MRSHRLRQRAWYSYSGQQKSWSTDENLLHVGFESGELEDPAAKLKAMYKLTKPVKKITKGASRVSIDFVKGMPVA